MTSWLKETFKTYSENKKLKQSYIKGIRCDLLKIEQESTLLD